MEARTVEEVVIKGINILDKIKKSKVADNKIVKVVKEIKKTNIKVLRNKKWTKKDRLILKNDKVYMPKNEELKNDPVVL